MVCPAVKESDVRVHGRNCLDIVAFSGSDMQVTGVTQG